MKLDKYIFSTFIAAAALTYYFNYIISRQL